MRSAQFQIRILFFLAALIGIGLIPKLKLKLNPSPKTQNMSISFRYPGIGPELVEKEVTSIIEATVSRLDNLESIESNSQEGSGHIEMTFNKKAAIADTRLMVSMLLRQVYPFLPKGVTYPIISYKSEFDTYPVLMVFAALSNLKSESLKKILEKEILSPLSGISGIHQIELTGLAEQEYILKVEEEKLKNHEIASGEIKQVISNWLRKQNLGFIKEPKSHHLLSLQYSSPGNGFDLTSELLQLPIKLMNGRVINIKDVATLEKQEGTLPLYYRINGKNSINLIIRSTPNVNQIELALIIKQKIKSIQRKLDKQVDLILETDHSEYLKKELTTLLKRMGAALAILLLFMVLIYRGMRKLWPIWYGFMVTLSFSGLVYYFMGIELHLYSLAGLTLSLGIVLDNLIISVEHLKYHQDQRIFLALLAATVTTAGALSVIFFVSPEYREQLTDFVWIFLINLGVSLIVALFFLPAIVKSSKKEYKRSRRPVIQFNRIYSQYSRWASRRMWILVFVLVLSFGLPLFLLPEQWEKEGVLPKRYNQLMNSAYGKIVHPVLSKYLGGTLQLFIRNKDRFFFESQKKEETKLYVRAKMPFGGTIDQLNAIIRDFESYLSQFKQIKQFHSRVSSPRNSLIEIRFQDAYSEGFFPFQLKALLERKSIESGSGDFQIFGVGIGFSNELQGGNLTNHLRLLGYNYDQLWKIAEKAREQLLENRRIQKVFINPTINYFEPTAEFFELNLNNHFLSFNPTFSLLNFFELWNDIDPNQGIIGHTSHQGNNIPIRLMINSEDKNQLWQIQNEIIQVDSNRFFKNKLFSDLEKKIGSNNIVRYNQQYQLFLEYDFIGNPKLADKTKKQAIKAIATQLPPGYQISDEDFNWWWKESSEELIHIVFASLVLIFLVSAVLFNSLKQALIPLVLVPPAFIGIFLATHFFEFKFDQGGFAGLLLVAGLSVNAGIFIINDYNNIRKKRPKLSITRAFIKAYNSKIIPIFLTTLSTILGLLPFLLFEQHEPFWYALALCTIAGLIFSFAGIVFFLPMFWSLKKVK